MLDHAEKILNLAEEKRANRHRKALTDYFVRNPGPANAKNLTVTGRLKELRAKLEDLDAALPPFSQAQAITDTLKAVPTHIHLRGDYRQNGPEVQPGTPGFLPDPAAAGKPTRLTLARWIVSPENPLTARVAVNRMWQELFGRGWWQRRTISEHRATSPPTRNCSIGSPLSSGSAPGARSRC